MEDATILKIKDDPLRAHPIGSCKKCVVPYRQLNTCEGGIGD